MRPSRWTHDVEVAVAVEIAAGEAERVVATGERSCRLVPRPEPAVAEAGQPDDAVRREADHGDIVDVVAVPVVDDHALAVPARQREAGEERERLRREEPARRSRIAVGDDHRAGVEAMVVQREGHVDRAVVVEVGNGPVPREPGVGILGSECRLIGRRVGRGARADGPGLHREVAGAVVAGDRQRLAGKVGDDDVEVAVVVDVDRRDRLAVGVAASPQPHRLDAGGRRHRWRCEATGAVAGEEPDARMRAGRDA